MNDHGCTKNRMYWDSNCLKCDDERISKLESDKRDLMLKLMKETDWDQKDYYCDRIAVVEDKIKNIRYVSNEMIKY